MNTLDLEACYRALGFREAPFRITPDTQFFFPHSQYLSAIGHLRFGMQSGGFTVLTGEVGLGKTLLCRYLLRNLPDNVRTAYVYNPQQTFVELLRSILHDLTGEMPTQTNHADLQARALEVLEGLISVNIRVAVLVDEAHRLSPDVLEGLRLLSNLETEKQKLLALLLVGQTELEKQLQERDMRALRDRIGIWHKLRPFGLTETASYINHRLDSARMTGNFRFDRSALLAVHYYSGGVPRRINMMCDRALLSAYVGGERGVTGGMMRRAAKEVSGAHA